MTLSSSCLRVLWLREVFPWMGAHSGYDGLCRALLQSTSVRSKTVWRAPDGGGMTRTRQTLCRWVRATRFYSAAAFRAEAVVILNSLVSGHDIVHVLYSENSLGVLRHWCRLRGLSLVATTHQPPSWWENGAQPAWALGTLDAVIAVSKAQAQYLEVHAPGRAFFVPHGVDSDFFAPSGGGEVERRGAGDPPRFVFVGTWLRDLATLAATVVGVLEREPRWQFDLVVPVDRRGDENLKSLADRPQIHWHAGLTDEGLRDVYRRSCALLLPLADCTCNNAVLEAMSCGVPVISTRVGGMVDYVSDDCGYLLGPGDVGGLVSTVLRLGRVPTEGAERGRNARSRVVRDFDWREVARQTMAVYQAALSTSALRRRSEAGAGACP